MIDASGSTALNNSYIVETSATVTAGSSKSYTVCPCDSNICRIRFDFTVSRMFCVILKVDSCLTLHNVNSNFLLMLMIVL